MSQNLTEKTLTFEYIVKESKVAKFEEESNPSTVSDKVANLDVNKFGISKGVKVTVKADDNGVVQFIQKVKEETQPESTTTEKETASNDTQVLTVHGIPDNKKVIKFQELPDKWVDVSAELQKENFDAKGIKARAKVRVKIEKVDGTETITAIEPTGEVSEKSKEPSSSPAKEYIRTGNNTTESIERQCAWKTAGEVLGKVLNNQVSVNDIELVKTKMRELAEEGIKFIQGS